MKSGGHVLFNATRHVHSLHSEWWHTHTHTHTHTCAGWDDGGKCSPHLTHPGVLPQGWPGAVGSQQCGARGPSPSARSCRGQGQDQWASVLLHVFLLCYGVLWGEPGWARGEHANSTQKGPGTSPDMLHHAGLEPTTFLLWGNSAMHWATVTTTCLLNPMEDLKSHSLSCFIMCSIFIHMCSVCVCVGGGGLVCSCVCIHEHFLLQPTQRHWGTIIPELKPREEVLLGGCELEGVDVCQCVWGPSYIWGHSVEGQSASRPVHIHSYSVRVRGAETYVCSTVVVAGSVTSISTIKTPGLVVPSKPAVITPSCPGDSSVCHSYINISYPLYLPVTAASQTLSTQHLVPGVKPLWVIRIRLLLSNHRHLSVVLRQREVSVGCVWVQCEFTGIWRENKTWLWC